MSTATPAPAHRRHDISDQAWETIAPHLSGGPGKVGRPAADNRRFSNAGFRFLRAGAPWRALPPDYGHRTLPRTASGAGRRAASGPNCWPPYPMTPAEWLMIDASQVKAHQHGTGAVGGNQAIGWTKGC